MAYYHRGGRFAVRSNRGGMRGRGRGGQSNGYFSSSSDNIDSDNRFKVHRPQIYRGAAPLVGQGQILGGYSVDEDRNFGHDRTMLKFLDRKYLPEDGEDMKVNMDLNRAAEKACLYSGSSEQNFHNFLQWILNNKKLLMPDPNTPRLDVDFIGVRNNLSIIMKTPYNYKEAWTLYATEFNGTVYMMRQQKLEADSFAQPKGGLLENFQVWGHKFEQYMSGGDPDDGVQANEEYRVAMKLMVDQTSLLFAPEVDCADPYLYEEDFKDLSSFVLVKCCRELKEPHKLKNHKRFKLLQWWIENKLSGIPRIVVGYRNDDGVVHTLQHLKTDDLPEISEGEWEPDVCVNFLVKFLAFVKSKVAEEPQAMYKFEREEKGNIYCTKLKDSSMVRILPSWYTEEIFSKDNDSDNDSETE
ncbi:decapping and exoribonuclease protein isoform X1 [Procambarus clarkii]|uniref:decapping and exoribonuclease protein isoform X1 n=1 Tax=Procambarus clarkii TaxID=6728 RepID=UPI003742FF9B